MSQKWSFLDELLRMAESYSQKPPSTITELLDIFEKVVPADKSRGWQDVTDSPRAATPPPPPPAKETPVAKSTMRIALFTCPACQEDVSGTASFAAPDDQTPKLDEQGFFSVNMKMTGVRVDAHDCTRKVVRDNGGCFTP